MTSRGFRGRTASGATCANTAHAYRAIIVCMAGVSDSTSVDVHPTPRLVSSPAFDDQEASSFIHPFIIFGSNLTAVYYVCVCVCVCVCPQGPCFDRRFHTNNMECRLRHCYVSSSSSSSSSQNIYIAPIMVN